MMRTVLAGSWARVSPLREAVGWLAKQRREEPLPARPSVVAAACLAGGCGLIRLVDIWPGESLAVACWGAAVAALVAWGLASWLGRGRVAVV